MAPEIQAHYNNWGENPSVATYFVNQMKNFAENRPSFAKNHIKAKFNLPNYHTITITSQNTSEGFVKVNENLKIQEPSWRGDYFETVPIALEAIPEAGFEFSHWSGAISSTDKIVIINLTSAIQVIPNFTKSTSEVPIVINEINYKSNDNFNADDWVELYNPNNFSVNVSNWQLKDDDDTHVYNIPDGNVIAAKGFLILVKDASDFSDVYPEITNFVGDFDFGLGTSDSVRLFNTDNVLQDQVTYDASWANCADETGKTLELIATDLDNSLPESWSCTNTNGSPNATNDETLSNDDLLINGLKIYPNPVVETLYISGNLTGFKVQIYNALGQEVLSLKDVSNIDVSNLNNGLYFIKIATKNKRTTLKFVKN